MAIALVAMMAPEPAEESQRGEIMPIHTQMTDVDGAWLLAGDLPSLGDANAEVVLVEFGDYQCVACNRFFHQTEGQIIRDYVDTGKVRFIFSDYVIIGPDSAGAAHAAHCARDQDMFWEYHDILYTNWAGENTGWASPENLAGFAVEIGLDTGDWLVCMNEAQHVATIQSNNEKAEALRLPGTPSFFVVGPEGDVTSILGPQSYNVFAEVIERELAR